VSADDELVNLLRLHPCVRGLSDEAVQEIAAATQVLRCEPGEPIHRRGDPVTSIYLVIHGRVRMTLLDLEGHAVMERYQSSGGQIGGIAAALAEPAPMECVAEDPSTLLKIDYRQCLALTKKHDAFRINFARLMADAVKRAVFSERVPNRPRSVALLHQTEATRTVSRQLFRRLVSYGEQFCVFTDQPAGESLEGVHEFQVLGGERDWMPDEVRRLHAQWLDAGRVFSDTSAGIPPARAANVLEKTDLILWCVTPQSWEASTPRLKDFESRAPGWRDKVCILWLLAPGETAPAADELRSLAARDIKVSFGAAAKPQGRVLFDGFERLVHLVRGVQIGVALGGGAARGMAHLGVLKALEQNGITVDMIAGTSAGAMTGTLYAAGLDPDFLMDRFVEDLTPSWVFRSLPRGDQWYLLYMYRMGRFDPMLRKYLGDVRIEQLAAPMHMVTVDLIHGQSVVRSGGDAVHGILESINLPVLSTPIIRPGQALVDGGLINNIPADVLASKGCTFIIAVSVTAKMETEFARNRPETPIGKMRAASTIQTILRSFLVQSVNLNAIGIQPADCVIEPDVTGFELTEFTRTAELAAVGEQATLAAIPHIKQLLHRLDEQMFAPQ
jgi:predicted acylesterase/phospholipase RssA/CRP-like cAMP-binding protein